MASKSVTFNVGDRVWVARAGAKEIRIPCPVCFGKLAVTLTLGNGDEVRLVCEFCSKGYGSPQGFALGLEYAPLVEERVVDRVSVSATEVEYQSDCTIFLGPDVFATEAEAAVRAEAVATEQAADRVARGEGAKHHEARSYAWNAGYHMREARDLRLRAESHERRASLCKSKAKSDGDAR